MRVNWVISAAASQRHDWQDYPRQMKTIGPIWGSWRTWMDFGTDNAVCHDLDKSQELINRAFHAVCNFYVYRPHAARLSNARSIHLYDGDYDHGCQDIEDIVSLHLAANRSDMVLLLGFDFGRIVAQEDAQKQQLLVNQKGLMRGLISRSDAQWVAIDHDVAPDPAFTNLPNFTRDTMENVLRLLSK